MPAAVQLLPINQIQDLTLEQCISPKQEADIFPFTCQLTELNLQIDSKCTCINLPEITTSNASVDTSTNSKIELVVFSNITIKQLQTRMHFEQENYKESTSTQGAQICSIGSKPKMLAMELKSKTCFSQKAAIILETLKNFAIIKCNCTQQNS